MDSGIAACLTPNDSPSRCAGTDRASVRFDASWPMTLHQAPQSRITTSEAYESANTASTSITTATPSTAIRLVTAPPQRSTSRPTGSEQSALTPK